MSVGVSMEGADQVAAAIRTKLLKMRVVSGGGVEIGVAPGGRVRSPEKNALIARVQSALQRNPWYLDKDTMTALRFVARGVASEDVGTVMAAIGRLGSLMVDAVRKNIGNQRNASGSTFAELTARYAAFKRRKYGFIHPILRATGDLMDNLKAVVIKGP